jgi:hypothetical protein
LLFCPTVFLPTINIKIKNPHQPPVHKNSHGFSTRKGKLERVVCFEREAEFVLDSSPFSIIIMASRLLWASRAASYLRISVSHRGFASGK